MDTSLLTLDIAGHRLAAVCLNPGAAGETTILLHGISSSIAFWQINPAAYLLAAGPCYSLSLPGHFPAVAPDAFKKGPVTAEGMVALLGEAVQRLAGGRPATLIGHSTGGFSVLALAAERPELARRVISISGFTHGRWTGALGIYQRAVRLGPPGRAWFKAINRFSALTPALYRWVMRFYTADPRAFYAHPDLPEALTRTYPNFKRLDLDALAAYFYSMPEIDITPRVARIQAPTLLLSGDSDPIVPPSQSSQAAALIAGAELALIRGAGHLPFTERADEYHRAVGQWLAKTR